MQILSWPSTDKEKTIPLIKKIPKGAMKTMHFWAYDERLGKAVIVCDDDVSFRLIDQVDLLNLAQEDLAVLACNQIRVTEKYEEVAKGWIAAVASVIHILRKDLVVSKISWEVAEEIEVRRTSMHKPRGRLLEPEGLFIEGYSSLGDDMSFLFNVCFGSNVCGLGLDDFEWA
ncbi:hypothetical protein Hanom_Chr10g00884331 [Helianthus anomalus]